MEIYFVLALMVVAIVLFSLESVPLEVVSLGLLVALLASGILTPKQALAGFANEAVITIGGLFVLTAGLRSSGALDRLGLWAQSAGRGGAQRSFALLLLVVAFSSAFMNNTTCTAVCLPIALALARGSNLPVSRVLMPVAFASILGGSITLIGTSTNVIVSGLMPQYGLEPLGMFELTPVGLPIAVAGLVYLIFASRWLLPAHAEAQVDDTFHVREYLAEARVLEDSELVGMSIAEADLGRRFDLNLVAIARGGEPQAPQRDQRFEAGDLLLIEGQIDTLLRLSESRGLAMLTQRPGDEPKLPASSQLKMVEAVVLPRSELVGRTLKEVDFRRRFGATVVGLNRHAESLVEKIGKITLRVGDVLLVHGEARAVERLLGQSGLVVLSHLRSPVRPPMLAWMATGTFALVIGLAASGVMNIAGAVLLGCLLLFLTRCLTPQEAYSTIEWRLLILIAGMFAYGQALEQTGAARWLATTVMEATGDLGPRAIIAVFYILTLVLTQPMSNQAAALVVLPIAMEVAQGAGLAPRAMALVVTLAASSSFLTPLEPSCLIVYGPGRYRFFDFPKLGAGLTLLALLMVLWLVPVFWPLT